jgi:hypothetical protein
MKYFEEELKDFCNSILFDPCKQLSEKQNPGLTQPEIFAVKCTIVLLYCRVAITHRLPLPQDKSLVIIFRG